LSLGHYSDGWSMEYGDGGQYTVEILLNGKVMAEAADEGNGGPILLEYKVNDHKAIDKAVLDYLIRTDEDFGPNSQYDFIRETVKTGKVDDSDYACFIQSLVLEFKNRKTYKYYFKQDYKLVALIKKVNGLIHYAASPTDDEKGLLVFIKKQKGYNEKDVITFVRPEYLTNTII
jgi:hypothetical protein